MFSKLLDALASPRAARILIPLSLLLMLPALSTGYVLDDLLFGAMKDAPPELPGLGRGPFELYDLTSRSLETLALRQEGGDLPWYTDPAYQISFFRPLSSLALWLDLSVSPRSGLFAHLHSFGWFALFLVALHRLYRRVASVPVVAGLGLLLACLDEAHAVSAGWIANRNAVMSVALATIAVALYVRGRMENDRRASIAAPFVFGVALLAGEMGVSLVAYVFAYAVCLDRASIKARVLSLLPFAFTIVAWRIVYRALHFGVHGTGLYIDPLASPGRFAVAVAKYVPTLLTGQFTPIQADMTFLVPPAQKESVFVLGAICTLLVAAIAIPVVRASAVARFAALGTLIACLPLASTEPANRVMLPVGIGGCLLTAELLHAIFEARKDPSRPLFARLPYRIVFGLTVATHLVIAPLTVPMWSYFPALFDIHSRHASRSLDQVGSLEGKTLVFVHTPDFFFSNWASIFRRAEGRPIAAAVRVLAETTDPIVVERMDPNTLRISDPNGLVRGTMSTIVRDPEVPLRLGFGRVTHDMTLEVTSVRADGKPTEIVCRFRRPLEDSSLVFVHWTPQGYRRFALPGASESTRLDGVDPNSLVSYRYVPPAEAAGR